jgi:Arc/MetJ family transcription regulator
MMQTAVLINDKLMKEALRYSRSISTEEEVIEIALKEYVLSQKQRNLKDLKGKIKFREDYDYKLMREFK